MVRFTLLALTHEGSLNGSAPPSFMLNFKGPLAPRSLGSATFRPSVPVPLCFQLSNFNAEVANPLFCAFSRHSRRTTRH
jgi:hypothetical protein